MTYPQHSGLPDPVAQADFYEDILTKRVIAWTIDAVITLVLTAIVVVLTFPISIFIFPLWFAAIGFIYRAGTLSMWSATVGMRLTSIEVRDSFGAPLNQATAFMHTLLYTVSASFVVPHVLSMMYAINSARSQMLHDFVLGTAVINVAGRN